ncbi:putative aspartyl aminopeptidase [Hibiscus syriacus]|uniref:Aspartyl aminopeptidase n=1 Tax=Hibiscus syriacus TaxID=106335 RepID=A0A6A2ZSW9_HIBSY|nr:putative aspartyl aminopeptidase [Hibiscus syriacus]
MLETEVRSVVSGFIGFLNVSLTAFHAVDEAKKRLQKIGYEQVLEREDWKLEAGKRYFFTRNHSTIVAFAVGRVMIREEKGGSVSYSHRLVRIEEPIMRIQLNKEISENGQADKTLNKSRHHALLLQGLIDATSSESDLENKSGVRMVALFDDEKVGSNSAQGAGSPAILDAVSRITNSFTSDSKMLTKAIQRSFLVSADMAHALHPNYMDDKHEENHQPKLHGGLVIKHNANQRYATNAVTSFIFREIAMKHNLPIQVSSILDHRVAMNSLISSIMPGSTLLFDGLGHLIFCLKENSVHTRFCGAERYAMWFNHRSGPASVVSIRTVDVGAPQLSMHSIREMCAVDDVKHSYELFKAFFQEFSQLDNSITVDGKVE